MVLLSGLQEVGVGGALCCPPWEVPNHFFFFFEEKQKVYCFPSSGGDALGPASQPWVAADPTGLCESPGGFEGPLGYVSRAICLPGAPLGPCPCTAERGISTAHARQHLWESASPGSRERAHLDGSCFCFCSSS